MDETGNAQILRFNPQVMEQDEIDEAPEIFSQTGPGQTADEESEQVRDRAQELRMVEAILFATAEPVPEKVLAERVGEDVDIASLMKELGELYSGRGVNLVRIGNNWAFRTADDLGFLLHREAIETKRLSRAALEVMSIIAYHQPVTRAEIEEIRGVVTSKGTLDVLLETGWIRMRGRRRTPGRPVTYGTTDAFLAQFGLEDLKDLPGLDELKGAGLLQSQIPAGFRIPMPDDAEGLTEDEDPLTPDDLEELGLLPPKDSGDGEEAG
ncbi:MAG: SMC-Scp complex subunit ScpB [Nitratireductor sp.]|nr:SMC-Scp complex subunit ScpB [Nitratireductor sp.]